MGQFGVVVVVVGAQLEQMRQSWEQEQKHFEENLLGSANPDDHRKQEHEFDFDEFDDQHSRHEARHQLLFENLSCKK